MADSIDTGCSQKGGMQYVPLNLLFLGLFLMFWAFLPFNLGDFSFSYFWGIWLKKKQISSSKKVRLKDWLKLPPISAAWIFGVAYFRFHYLRHFSISFKNSWAHIVANFLKFLKLPNILYLCGFKNVMDINQKNIEIRKYAEIWPFY